MSHLARSSRPVLPQVLFLKTVRPTTPAHPRNVDSCLSHAHRLLAFPSGRMLIFALVLAHGARIIINNFQNLPVVTGTDGSLKEA